MPEISKKVMIAIFLPLSLALSVLTVYLICARFGIII